MKTEVMQEVFVIGKHSLKTLLDRVKDAVPNRAGRHSVSAVKFESDGTRLRAVASDGYRVAIAEVPLSTITKFPPYGKALSVTDFKTELKFSAHSLRAALFQIKPAIDRHDPRVVFQTVGQSVVVSAGDAKAVLACKKTGKNNKVALNPHFVSDFLSQVTDDIWLNGVGDEVTMQIGGTMPVDVDGNGKKPKPVLVRLSNGPEYAHLVMPLLPKRSKRPVSSEQTSNSSVDAAVAVS